MPLIDKSYFVGDINIPDTGNAKVLERLNFFIGKHEPEFLKQVLGYSLWKAYTAGIAVTPTPAQKWLDLRDGVEYTVGDVVYFYSGLRTVVMPANSPAPAVYKSPIANYIYYWWKRSDTKAKPDDAEQQQAFFNERNQSMIRAWNEMAEWVNGAIHFLNNNNETYSEWQNVNWLTVYAYNSYSLWNLAQPINDMNL
jgi:hypothetical protein